MTTGNDFDSIDSTGSTGLTSAIVIGGATITLLGLCLIALWSALSQNLHILIGVLGTFTN